MDPFIVVLIIAFTIFSCILSICIFSYLGSRTHGQIHERKSQEKERAARRAHELALEQEKTMREQTTWPLK